MSQDGASVSGEFELIHRYFQQSALTAAAPESLPLLGIGDDAALLHIDPGQHLVISTDSQVSGVHFPLTFQPADIAYRGLAAAVSDLAAMGAAPLGFTLALTLPDTAADWLAGFASGLAQCAQDHRINLIGGDTTRGPLNLGFSVLGQVPDGQALRRSGAQPGDLLCVGGSLGDGGAGLQLALQQPLPDGLSQVQGDYLHQRFWRPRAQLDLGIALRGRATAALDISDGLLADAAHIAAASGVAVHIEQSSLPASEALQAWPENVRNQWMLRAGDDYRLLFSLPAAMLAALRAEQPDIQVIGKVQAGSGVWLDSGQGLQAVSGSAGYQHFSPSSAGAADE
ncbi:thiamine-phosphate kinase [Halopseudomonas salegens]|uniref:Thiamine-monophosphate kinase n=1 Tax=Halopseudomonas salegens TaxID=1434072 RepID=A0A1H2EHF9_9GAMM|nr:thiamine-phosphate kinase [Halopseudomonas salegens]SDT94530.1 thiamine-phosphate kinase [Halopseudomonas salegens]